MGVDVMRVVARHHLEPSLLATCFLALVGLSGCVNPVSNSQTVTLKIEPFAGVASQGYSGDSGPALQARLNYPTALAFDSARNLFIADWNNHAIRRVDPNGKIVTVAGKGTLGYSGDGGPATAAELNNPNSVAIDAYGNLFISDWGNNVVRKVDTNGIITTFAGTGLTGYSGDGGSATAAWFYYPLGLAVDSSGNVYISDSNNSVVRKVNTNGIISTYAGNHAPGYSGDGGPATSAQLSTPGGLIFDPVGNLLICDSNNGVIRKVDSQGKITTVVGNGISGFAGDGGAAGSAELNAPGEMVLDALGNLFIADTGNQRIRRVSPLGIVTTVAGNGTQGFSGDNDWATSAQLNTPTGVATDASGNLYIADQQNSAVRKVVFNTIGKRHENPTSTGPSGPTQTEDGPSGFPSE